MTRKLVALIALIVLSSTAQADPPRLISHQGLLTLPSGQPVVDGTYSLTFRVYNAATGGSQYWSETHAAVPVEDGLYAVTLGNLTSLNLTFDLPLWLGISVGNDPELTPRVQLTSSPYALGLSLPYSTSLATGGPALAIHNLAGPGIRGESDNQAGVEAWSQSGSGLSGVSATGKGIYGQATQPSGYAGWFDGTTYVNGKLGLGVLSPAAKLDIGGTAGVDGIRFPDGTVQTSAAVSSSSLWQQNGSDIYYNAGKVGIGTQNPINPLHIVSLSPAADIRFGYYDGFSSTPTAMAAYTGDPAGVGVIARATGTSSWGVSGIGDRKGVFGQVTGNYPDATAVQGRLTNGRAIHGECFGLGFAGYFDGNVAVNGKLLLQLNDASSGPLTAAAAFDQAASATGVHCSGGRYGLRAFGTSETEEAYGVYANISNTGYAIYGDAAGSVGYAGYFNGPTAVVGTSGQVLRVNATGAATHAIYTLGSVHVGGTLTKSGGAFKIDHPLDPEGKYLQHSFVESPDMMNIYNGNITTDRQGYAEVEMPAWFEALNRDFRYQLTVIGSFSQAMIAEKLRRNRFVIRTSEPSIEVSWQITGIRQDAYAERNRIPVEVEKAGEERGRYLHPTAYGRAVEEGIAFED